MQRSFPSQALRTRSALWIGTTFLNFLSLRQDACVSPSDVLRDCGPPNGEGLRVSRQQHSPHCLPHHCHLLACPNPSLSFPVQRPSSTSHPHVVSRSPLPCTCHPAIPHHSSHGIPTISARASRIDAFGATTRRGGILTTYGLGMGGRRSGRQ
ncbi:hypothetical protein OF83DRAFT_717593 [Amylostereum chailletii]|nr:hypothetical protein OF83DRAFT_717593 [Amylostereum chailletii]